MRASAFFSLASLLIGCAPSIAIVPTQPVYARKPDAVKDFHVVGRLAVRYQGGSFSGSIDWRHSLEKDELQILTPLGQSVAQIERRPFGATLTTKDQEKRYAADVETLTEQALGWRLPLGGLRFWVLGLIDPESPGDSERDDAGRVSRLKQSLWQVDYLEYAPASGFDLPRRITARNGAVEVKLVVDQWRIDAPTI
ncbi:MAG: lipoprotein insertase outer membrane protein LolB [Burkholderiales bacterium]